MSDYIPLDEAKRRAGSDAVINIAGDSRLRAVSIEDFLRSEFPPREMLLNPWLPSQGMAMIFAMRGLGKTHFGLGFSYAIASAGLFLKWQAPRARRVLYIDGEMPAVAMQERLASIVAGAEKEPPSDFFRLITPDLQEFPIPDLSSAEGQAEVDRQLAGAELLVFDNISTLFRSGAENEAESWGQVQDWALSLRRRGVSTVFVHHAGKSGQQRGTSRREDILDTIVSLRRPNDYVESEGARFEIHFEKARGVHGSDLAPFEARLETRDGAAFWTIKDIEDRTTEQVADLANQGLSQRDIGLELGISKSAANRHIKKGRALGLIDT